MPLEPQNEEVVTEDSLVEETPEVDESKLIQEKENVELKKKISAVVGVYTRKVAQLSDEDIYQVFEKGVESPVLLTLANESYSGMIAVGGDLPKGHFDHYKRLVADIHNIIVSNIDAKLDANRDTLVAVATGKTEEPDRISHKDIIDALEKKD